MTRLTSFMACLGAMLAVCGAVEAQAPSATGSRFYCDERELGHWFYCSRPAPEEEEGAPADPTETPTELTSREEQLERARAYVQEIEEARLIAAFNPTPENVLYYQQLQYDMTERSAMFTDRWRRNTWSDASLDYTTERPMAQYARHEWLDQRSDEMAGELEDLSDRYGLFYFYRSDCPYCQRFSPVLRAFADRFGVEVRAISVDGGPMPAFPDARPDTGQFSRLLQGRQAVVPAVLLLDVETDTPHWITFGLISGQELAERIFVTMTREPGEDF